MLRDRIVPALERVARADVWLHSVAARRFPVLGRGAAGHAAAWTVAIVAVEAACTAVEVIAGEIEASVYQARGAVTAARRGDRWRS